MIMHRRRSAIIIVLQLAELFLTIVILISLSGCATSKGLHPENSRRNANVKWQQYVENGKHVVK